MAYRKLPRVLRQKIANYYEHRYQGKMFNEVIILDELSECLREVRYNISPFLLSQPLGSVLLVLSASKSTTLGLQ